MRGRGTGSHQQCLLRTPRSGQQGPRLSTAALRDSRREPTVAERLRSLDLLPLGSRIRRRLVLEAASSDELLACLEHLLETAGNSALMTEALRATLVDHAVGNYRILMNLCDEILAVGADRGLPKLDEKLYLGFYAAPPKKAVKRRYNDLIDIGEMELGTAGTKPNEGSPVLGAEAPAGPT